MAAVNPPSRQNAASVLVAFGPSEALTAIKMLLPRLDNWHVNDDGPQEFCGWITINQLKARTFGDLIRGPRPSPQASSSYSDVFELVSDRVWHGEPPAKASTESTAAAAADFTITLIRQPESLIDRGKTLELLTDFADRLEARRTDADWKHLASMFDRLLKLPAYDGVAASGYLGSVNGGDKWLVVGRNIQSIDARLFADLDSAARELCWKNVAPERPSTDDPKREGTAVNITNEEKAIAMVMSDHGLSVKDVAAKLGVRRNTPYRWDNFVKIFNGLRSLKSHRAPRRGSKDSDGKLEAEDDSE